LNYLKNWKDISYFFKENGFAIVHYGNSLCMITKIWFEDEFGFSQAILEGEYIFIDGYFGECYTNTASPIRLATREECVTYINEKYVKIKKE